MIQFKKEKLESPQREKTKRERDLEKFGFEPLLGFLVISSIRVLIGGTIESISQSSVLTKIQGKKKELSYVLGNSRL